MTADQKIAIDKLVKETAQDPELIKLVRDIEAGPNTTKGNYGRYMSVLSGFKDKSAVLIMAQALKRAGGNAEGINAAQMFITG